MVFVKNRRDECAFTSGRAFPAREASLQRHCRDHHKCRNPARISRICLECAAIFGHLPLTIRCRLGDYTRAMMIKRILTIGAALCCLGGRRGRNFARAGATGLLRRLLPAQPIRRPRRTLSARADYRRGSGRPDFDGLDDEDGPNAQSSTALPPPGPVLSPDDPRYGRPMNARPGLFRPCHADRSGAFAG